MFIFEFPSIGKELTIGVLEKLETVIGLRIIRDRKNRTMEIDQSAAVEKMIQKYHLDGLRGRDIPYLNNTKYSKDQMPASEEDRLDTNEYPFLSLMMTISHIACYSRLELKFPLSQLRKYQHNPGLEHWKGLLVIAAYLKKHPNR